MGERASGVGQLKVDSTKTPVGRVWYSARFHCPPRRLDLNHPHTHSCALLIIPLRASSDGALRPRMRVELEPCGVG
jgi:hypothetical protein